MKHLLLLACLSWSCTFAGSADSLRCNGRIITVGVPAAYVFSECGAPANQFAQESVVRSATVSGGSRLIGIGISEQWIYDRGWGNFPAVLVFLDGTLRRIDFLPHRSDDAIRVLPRAH